MKNIKYFILGAQKCGTSSAYQYISCHPQASCSSKKENNVFSTKDIDHQKIIEWENSFSKNGIRVDVSSLYIYQISAIKNILKYNKDSRFIILIRKPIERLKSHYKYYLKHSSDISVSQFLKAEPESLHYSMYSKWIKSLELLVKPENIRVIRIEDNWINQMNSFIGLDEINYDQQKRTNDSTQPRFKIINKFLRSSWRMLGLHKRFDIPRNLKNLFFIKSKPIEVDSFDLSSDYEKLLLDEESKWY